MSNKTIKFNEKDLEYIKLVNMEPVLIEEDMFFNKSDMNYINGFFKKKDRKYIELVQKN